MIKKRFPFPAIPETLKEKYGIKSPELRPPGLSETDLEIDFHQPRGPFLVTQILQNFTETSDGVIRDDAFFWDLTVGTRIETLSVIALTGTGAPLELQLYCTGESCREQMEMGLTMQEITEMNNRSLAQEINDSDFAIPIDQKDYYFRKPTGRDQREWLERSESYPDDETALQAMIDRLWVRDDTGSSMPRDSRWLAAVDNGMKEIDPLVHTELTVSCPVCNCQNVFVLDLEDLLMQKLQKIQRKLLFTVHRLASRYHWSEQQVFAVSPRRRDDYLELIEVNSR